MKRNRRTSISQNPVVRRFVVVVAEYCQLVEAGTRRRKKLLRQFAELLPELFHLAIQLPTGRKSERIRRELYWIAIDDRQPSPLDPKHREAARKSRYRNTFVSVKRFFAMSKRLAEILGPWDRYREVFDPYKDKEPIQTTLSNDLAEIWHDVKRSLLLYNMGDETSMRHAVYDWALSVRIHWGSSHFSGAIKTIFFALETVDDDWQFPEFARRKK